MKSTINMAGELIIQLENQLESYAFKKWCEENLGKSSNEVRMSDVNINWEYIGPIERKIKDD